ncbi:hypothetical protein BGLT_01624 [Caballeronia glathei]|nr:hypothetical protein BGLT_01624 [Caballeronia glathei]
MREEYRFAKEFLLDQEKIPAMHPFMREKGYQAIAGDARLSADEIEYLLSLRGASRALRDYTLGRGYLRHLPQQGNLQVQFKEKYQSIVARRVRKYWFVAAYAVLSFLGFFPFVFSRIFFHNPGDMLFATGVTLLVFLPSAWLSLRSAIRLDRAEKLVKHQSKHTQRIVLEPIDEIRLLSPLDRTLGKVGSGRYMYRKRTAASKNVLCARPVFLFERAQIASRYGHREHEQFGQCRH